MKQKFNAGVELDMITKDEVKDLLQAQMTSWFNEVAKGDRYKRFSAQATVLADGTVTFGQDAHNRVGPNDGFIWSLKRLNIGPDTGIDPSTDDVFLFFNDANPSSMIRQLAANYSQFGTNEVVLYPGDSLVITSSSLTAGDILTISGAVRELPLPMGWRLD